MDDERIGCEASERIQAIELCRGCLVQPLGCVDDPGSIGRRGTKCRLHRLLAVDVQGVRPAEISDDASGKRPRQQRRVERIVVGDGRDAAQQILDTAEK